MSEPVIWQYRVEQLREDRLSALLDKMGSEGWELVTVYTNRMTQWVFKRPARSEPGR